MESIGSTSLAAHARSKMEFKLRVEQPHHTDKVPRQDDRDNFKPSRHGGNRAVRVFRADVMHRLTVKLSAISAFKFDSVNAYRDSQTPADAAADVLAIARQVAEQSNEKPSDTLRHIRKSVAEASSASKGMVEMNGEAAALAKAEGLINRGLDQLRKSDLISASALEMKAKIKQSSTIKIRTQEGDTVKLELRRSDNMSASDYAVQSGSGSASMTEISLSSRSRLTLKIDGHLNDAELEAIQNVFEAAESLADEFFAGDIAAALEIVAGLEFDSEQLARVSIRLKSSERINVSQSVRQFAQAEDNAPAIGAAAEAASAAAEPAAPTAVADIVSAPVKSPEPTAPISSDESPSSGGFLSGFESLVGFLSQLADYLEETAAAFSESIREDSPGMRIRFKMTESIQLEILRVVMNVNASDHAETDPEPSGNAIQQLAGDLETDHG